MEKRAFITGITGQDGSYLTELLLSKGYLVYGLVRDSNALPQTHIGHLVRDPAIYNKRLILQHGTFEDVTHLRRMILKAQPHEFYHLAGLSSPRLSLELPETTLDSVGMGTLRLLEIMRDLPEPPKFFYPSSSEVFGSPPNSPQDEETPIIPTTPYGAAKALSQQMTRIYRSAYGLSSCSAILYNHESPRRGPQFVTMKIARAAALIKKGHQVDLKLGNMDGKRDWGWAPDYVLGMWMMLQQEKVDDFVLATGELHSVRDLVEMAFSHVGLDWKDHVIFDAGLLTAVEPISACGNPTKARNILGWKNNVPLKEIMARMVDHELAKN